MISYSAPVLLYHNPYSTTWKTYSATPHNLTHATRNCTTAQLAKCPWPLLSTNLSLSESDMLRWCSRLAIEPLVSLSPLEARLEHSIPKVMA